MKKSLVAAAFGAAVLMALSGCSLAGGSGSAGNADATDKTPIRIGAVLPLSGAYTILGAPQKAALDLEAKKINADGGILGRKVTIDYRDDTTDPTKSVQAYNELAATGKYDAMLTSSMTAASQAAAPSAEQYQIPTLSLGPVNSLTDGSNKWDFVIPGTASVNAEATLRWMASTGIKKIAVAYIDGDAYGEDGLSSTQKFAQQLGVEIVDKEGFDRAGTDFAPMVQKVLGTGADAFLVWGAGAAPSIITGQFAAMKGSSPMQLVMTGSQASNLYTYSKGKVVPATEGVYLASDAGVPGKQLPPSDLKTMVDDFAARWAELGDPQYKYPPQFAFEAAKALDLFKDAMTRAKSTDKDKVRDAIESTDLMTYTGRTKYSPTDHGGIGWQWFPIDQIKNGDFVATDYGIETLTKALG
jgi:branched-chain amino acid transport system substrate-binding protein